MSNKEFENTIPTHYTRNGKMIWYRLLLNDQSQVTAYPDPETRIGIKTDWISKGTSKKIKDEEVQGWKKLL